MAKRFVASCLFLLAFAMVSQVALAQAVFGNIIGTVTDQSGAAVPNAKVTVTDVRKGTSDVYTTNADGNYSATHLIPDPYKVRIEAQGFKTAESPELPVNVDSASRFDAKLEVGQVSESVEVTSEAPQLKTDRADVSTTFDTRMVSELPVLNRNFTNLELQSPGAQILGWGHAATENPQGSQQIMVNGQHFSGTAYELDGTDNQDPILGIIVVNPNIDAISEAKITTADYDAEFGKAVAGVVTVQTKSGSNDLHGSGFWYRRTDATEARNPFSQYSKDPVTGRYIPKDRWNQFGATMGGPIVKNKLFIFGDYQGTRQASGITNTVTVPTAALVSACTGAGDGSGYCKLNALGYGPYIGTGVNNTPGGLIYDPNTGDKATGLLRTPFCGPAGSTGPGGVCNDPTQTNWIPMNRISTVAQNILKAFPTPTLGNAITNNFVGGGSGPYSANSFDTRVDYDASQTVQVFGRFSLARFSLAGVGILGTLGGPGTGQLGLAGNAVTHNYSLATGVTKTFSPTLLADFRFGYFKYNPTTHKPDEGKNAADSLGLKGLNTGNIFTSGLPSFTGAGPISDFGEGLNIGRCNCPLVESEQQFQWVNNWTKMKGNHQIKFGADIRYAMNLRVPSDSNRTGQLSFNTGPTSLAGTGGSGLASMLLGEVNYFERFVSTSTTAAERQKRWFFYGQDSWRITPKLTVNYGLRWEIYFPESVNGKGNGGFANPVEGIIRIAGYGKYGLNGNIDNSLKAFAPRLGVAYQINQKTVLRMGYGRSFDMGVFGSNFGHAVTQNLPVLVKQTLTPTNNAANMGYPAGVNPNYYAAYLLDSAGPPAFQFPAIPSNGVLPLGGPGNNVQPRMRPTSQRLPTLDAWNITVQRQITPTITAEVGYVGNKGTHVFAGNGPAYDLNPAPYGPGKATVTGSLPIGTPCSTAGANCAVGGFSPNTAYDQRRPFYNAFTYPGYIDPNTNQQMMCCTDGIMGNYYGNDANAHYNSLQAKVTKRFSQGLQFNSSYTYSHATNQSVDGGFLYVGDRKQSIGPDDFNRNHVWILSAVYDLPFGKGKSFAASAGRALDLLIGGWQISDSTNWSSGLPWTAYASNCGSISDTGPCLPDLKGGFAVGAKSFDPNDHSVVYFTPVSSLSYSQTSINSLKIGDDACSLARPTGGPFSLPACGTGGNVGRNSFRGPGAFTDDMAVTKAFHIGEKVNTQFRMDAYNVFNHPVLGNPNNCIDCSGNDAGKIRGLAGGYQMRTLQFGLKLSF